MRGLQALQAMRRDGYAPRLVNLDAEPGVPCLGGARDPAHLVAEEGDRLDRLDLRCLVGLTVAVCGCDAGRVAAVCAACTAAGAARVIGTTLRFSDFNAEPHFAPASVTDTEGAFSWQA